MAHTIINASAVKQFVEEHHATMSRVTYNEAVKYI
jgi:hypothetical protein